MNRAWWVFGLALGGGITWLVGLVALGIWSEDVCLADGIPSASTYVQSLRVWPPALVCEYQGAGSSGTVAHTIRGAVIVGWTYAVPLLTVAGMLVWTMGPSWRPATPAGAERV